jgi:hypothetical protein
MTEITPEQLATMARAMGHEVEIDVSGGYGVHRVLIIPGRANGSSWAQVFNPLADAAQAWEVLCWLLDPCKHNSVNCFYVRVILDGPKGADGHEFPHNNTPSDLRRAVVTAAIRVAEDAK